MKKIEVHSYIDHTILKPDVSWDEVLQIGKEVLQYQFATACIPPCFVRDLKQELPEISICTVIGFPLGYESTASKLYACKKAIEDGANEVDLVVNVALLKSNKLSNLSEELSILTQFVHEQDKKVKWIFENSLLTQEDIIILCNLCNEIGPDFAKTSTGFGKYGARMGDVQLMKHHLDDRIMIKASGGIRSLYEAAAYINLGVTRIGTSSGIKIVSEYLEG